jgi:hypothetical protein
MDQTTIPGDLNIADGQRLRLPGGYRVRQFGGRDFIVPEFLDLSSEQALAAIEHAEKDKKRKLNEVGDL